MIPLVIVAAVACVAIVATMVQQERHANQVSRLLAHFAAEQTAHARERWSLATRLQAPEVATQVPAPLPADPQAMLETLGVIQPQVIEDALDDELDESHLVGTVQ